MEQSQCIAAFGSKEIVQRQLISVQKNTN